MISIQAVRTLLDAVVQAGVPRSSFIRSARLEPALLHASDARVPRSKLYELFELALELTGDPAFGLHSIERLPNDALDPIGGLVTHAATLGEAMSSIEEFRRLLGDEASFRVSEDRGKVTVRVNSMADEPLHRRRFVAETAVAGLFRTMQRFCVEENIDAVNFEYAAPEYHREYMRFFKGRVRFERAFTGLLFDSRLLLAAGPFPDAQLHQTLTVFAKRRIMHLTNCLPYSARVHECLVWQPPPRDMTMRTVACALGVSERSLRRRLAEEGKPYPKLVNQALAFIAKTCLLDERRTIGETALELGFADNTTFHRAFKRWTGLTPSEYRAQQTTTVNDTGAGLAEPATTTRA